MKLTILGSGTGVPSGERNSAGYFLETGRVALMMDCGAGTVHALARFGLPWESMTHLFISHFHADHVAEMPSLMHALKWGTIATRGAPLTILGPRGLDRVIEGFGHALGSSLFQPGFPVSVQTLDPGTSTFLADDCSLTVTKTPHTDESVAVRIEAGGAAVCYTGDTAFSEDVADFFGGCDLMVSECSFQERKPGVAHLSIEDVSRMAARACAQRLVVTHRYFDSDEAELSSALGRYYAGQINIGRDGMVIEV
jgi:ribonuclease BN (tRNA processing enzyme)